MVSPTVALVVLGVAVLVGVLTAVAYLSRARALSRRVGSFDCPLRETADPTAVSGIAQFGTAHLAWWRLASLAPRPHRTWRRDQLEVLERVTLDEVDELGRPKVRVSCRHDGATFELWMSSAALSGLVSWLEAGPRPVGRVP